MTLLPRHRVVDQHLGNSEITMVLVEEVAQHLGKEENMIMATTMTDMETIITTGLETTTIEIAETTIITDKTETMIDETEDVEAAMVIQITIIMALMETKTLEII